MNAPVDVKSDSAAAGSRIQLILNWILVAALVYLLLVAVSMIGSGFKDAAGDQAKELFAFASNPFTGLVIGTIATALIQSSSTVTSIIVGLVAGGLPVPIAIPMIMGANVGTSITNTLVSIGHIRDGKEFKRAFSAATIHDIFNLMGVAIFLPIEIVFHPLEKSAGWLSNLLVGGQSVSMSGFNFIKPLTKPALELAEGGLAAIFPAKLAAIATIVFGVVLIFLVISYIGKALKVIMVGKAREVLHAAIGKGPVLGIFVGTVVTVLVQSSSTTTSLIVPLAGAGLFTLRQVYPFTLGANIGTCITALLASTAVAENQVFALQIALVHMIYNFSGVVVIYGVPFLRELPIKGATWLAEAAVRRKVYALAYLLGVFFVIPGLLISVSHFLGF